MSDHPLAHTDLASTPLTWTTLTAIASTDFVPKALRGNPAACLAAVYTGRELGIGPMEAMQKIDIIDGRPALSSELLVAMVRRAGGSITISDETPGQSLTVHGRHPAGDEMSVTFTIDDAKRAGLTDKSNWKKYADDMLWARAVSRLCRRLFPDVLSAVRAYTPDDLGDSEWVPDRQEIPRSVCVFPDCETEAVLGDTLCNVHAEYSTQPFDVEVAS